VILGVFLLRSIVASEDSMPRQPRIFLPNLSVHVIHRGNNRMSIFHDEDDYRMLLALLERSAVLHRVDVHGYVLMTNHIHLLASPRESDSLPKAMKAVAGRYARYYNDRHKRIGTLWNGRYRSILIDSDIYWLTCLRYIEQNPVRAAIVPSVGDYPWSSYAAHALPGGTTWLSSHPVYQELGRNADARQRAYRALCGVPVAETEVVPPQGVNRGQTGV
jgi:putative transposase